MERGNHGRAFLVAACLGLVCLAMGSPVAAAPEKPGDVVRDMQEDVAEILEQEAADADEEGAAPDPLVTDALELIESLERLQERRGPLEATLGDATGEDREVLEDRVWRLRLESHAALLSLSDNILRQEKAGRDVAKLKAVLQTGLTDAFPLYVRFAEQNEKELTELRKARDEAEPAARLGVERELTSRMNQLHVVYRALFEVGERMQALGLDVSDEKAQTGALLTARADTAAARLAVSRQTLDDLIRRAEGAPDDAVLAAEIGAVEERLDRVTDTLAGTIALLARLDLDTAVYQQTLIQQTGEITADLLDVRVVLGLLASWRDQMLDDLAKRGPSWIVRALVFVAILLAFRVLAAIMRRIVSGSVESSRVNLSQLLQQTLVSWSSRVVMAIGLLVAASQLGIQIGPLLAGLGIAGFVLGFALQDSLSNFAAGAMILMYRPFDVGDVIEAAGIGGTVERMSLVSTTFLTFDNQTLIVPNNKIWGDVIRNLTSQKVRRIDLVFRVGYADDIDHVESVLRDVLASHDKVLPDPKPIVEVHELGESSLEFICRPWVRTEDYWPTRWALTRRVKQRFDQEGITIPYPQQDVHHHAAATSEDPGRT